MRRFVPYFIPIAASMTVAGALLGVIDIAHASATMVPQTTNIPLLLHAFLLALCVTVGAALLISVVLVLGAPAVGALYAKLGDDDANAERVLAAVCRCVVAPSGDRWWAWPLSLLPFVAGILITPIGKGVVPLLGLTNLWVTIANAVWATFSFVIPLLVHRLICWKWPAWRGRESLCWGLVAFWAHFITTSFWMAASPFTLFGAVPLMLLPAGAAAFAIFDYSESSRKVVSRVAMFVCGTSLVVLVAYPSRSAAHAELTKGSVVGIGSWQILAALSDLDGDRATSFLGGVDCDGLDYDIRASGMEVVGNGIDDNCFGGDLPTYEPSAARIEAPTAPTPKPPIIIITVDTLRADAVGRQVDGRRVTPEIDNLLNNSVHFTNGYSTAAGTDESIPALMTGMYPSDWHQYGIYFGVEPSLAEILAGYGYQTMAVVLLPWLRAALIHGFDIIDNSLGEAEYRIEQDVSGAKSTRLALKYLDERDTERPVCLWVHYYDVHLPREPVPELGDWLGRDTYAQHAHLTDNAIADFLVGLEQRGLLNSSVIVFASDHGEAVGEHNMGTHGWAVWESVVRVPLAVRFPGVPAAKVATPVSLVDMAPTLLDYLGFSGLESRDGRSMMPVIAGGQLAPRPIYIEAEIDDHPAMFSVIDDQLKLTVDLPRSAYHLYDLRSDPMESNNLVDERPDDVARLLKLLGQWRDGVFNDVRLERKRSLWEERSQWKPSKLVTNPDSYKDDETLSQAP